MKDSTARSTKVRNLLAAATSAAFHHLPGWGFTPPGSSRFSRKKRISLLSMGCQVGGCMAALRLIINQ